MSVSWAPGVQNSRPRSHSLTRTGAPRANLPSVSAYGKQVYRRNRQPDEDSDDEEVCISTGGVIVACFATLAALAAAVAGARLGISGGRRTRKQNRRRKGRSRRARR